MPQPITLPRRPLSEPEDAHAQRQIDRWEAEQPNDTREQPKRPVTFNSSV